MCNKIHEYSMLSFSQKMGVRMMYVFEENVLALYSRAVRASTNLKNYVTDKNNF